MLLIPSLTVKNRGGKAFVRVLGADGKAAEREIRTGMKDSMNTEVKSGLKEGDKVVISEITAAEQQESGERVMGGPPRR